MTGAAPIGRGAEDLFRRAVLFGFGRFASLFVFVPGHPPAESDAEPHRVAREQSNVQYLHGLGQNRV